MAQVIGLAELIVSWGKRADMPKLAHELHMSIQTLLPLLNAAHLLGIVNIDGSDVVITPFGLSLVESSRNNRVNLIRDAILNVEPFRTAYKLTSEKGEFTVKELAEELARKGIRWDHDEDENVSVLFRILMRWTVYTKLFSYDGRSQNFRLLES
ncbi:MAG: AAA-associated domain-containing protein [Nitrososphaerota archaeon]